MWQSSNTPLDQLMVKDLFLQGLRLKLVMEQENQHQKLFKSVQTFKASWQK
jgi:hypothetical protein